MTVLLGGRFYWREYASSSLPCIQYEKKCLVLFQKFLAPYFFGPTEEEKKIAALQKSIAELESNIKEVVAGVSDMKKSVGEQKDDLKQIVLDSAASRVSEVYFSQLFFHKGQLRIFKALYVQNPIVKANHG